MVYKFNDTSDLPPANGINVGCLSRLFDNTTTSYKYVFFLSLLEILSYRFFDASKPILLKDILIEMLVNSWYPHCFFRLSFGLQDQIASQLNRLELVVGKQGIKGDFQSKEYLRELIRKREVDNSLLNYVPFRINTPFFRQELKGLKDYQVNKAIIELSNEYFQTRKPLFRYTQDILGVVVHPEWSMYFKANYAIVKGWILWEWLQYLQKCNPSIPAISNKLFPPQCRESLSSQTTYWKSVLDHIQLRCIYSGELLQTENLSLDHYLPWSFVTHDLLWNLIPTSRQVNSSKSDNLPSREYFEPFVAMQHSGLLTTYQNLKQNKWNNYIEPYILELRVTSKYDLLDLEKLRCAYEAVLLPQINLAISHGFTPNWRYH